MITMFINEYGWVFFLYCQQSSAGYPAEDWVGLFHNEALVDGALFSNYGDHINTFRQRGNSPLNHFSNVFQMALKAVPDINKAFKDFLTDTLLMFALLPLH